MKRLLLLIVALNLAVISNQAPTTPQPLVRVKVPPPRKDFSRIGSSSTDAPTTSRPRYGIAAGMPSQDISANTAETFVESGIEASLRPDGTLKMKRMIHKIGNYPVWNSGAAVISRDDQDVSFLALPSSNPSRYARGVPLGPAALADVSQQVCQNFYGEAARGRNVTAKSMRFVYNKDVTSGIMYADLVEIRGYYSNNGSYFLKYCLINPHDSSVMKSWSGINDAVVGGNLKIGKYTYAAGAKRPSLPTTALDDGQCELANADRTVKIYDMQKGTFRIDDRLKTIKPAKYDCSEGPNDGDGKSYGPLADTFYHVSKVMQLMINPDYGNIKKDKITPSGIIKVGVHYGEGVDNAFWDGDSLYLGDGLYMFYALGSCLDVVAHEINHGVTQMTSGLIYSGESGCLNEAFSDVMGEFAEYYINRTNDFLVASKCTAPPQEYLRDMSSRSVYSDFFQDPSASHDPHSCSAIPNYIFYKLATSPGWTTKEAGQAWLLANRLLWKRETNLHDAGCGVATMVQKANILGGDTQAVVSAWRAGGIDITDCAPDDIIPDTGDSDATSRRPQTTTTAQYDDYDTTTRRRVTTTTTKRTYGGDYNNPKRIKNCVSYTGISARRDQMIYYVVNVPETATYQYVLIYANNGDADLYISIDSPPTQSSYRWAPFWTGSDEWVLENIRRTGVDYYIMIHAVQGFHDLELNACFS